MEFDDYLSSSDALRQTESAQGTVLHPNQVLDGMRVLAFLGCGATSEVWRVHDLKQDRDYALKVFAPAPDSPEQASQRFLTEARALDEFRHPNLMRRYHLQETGVHLYYTMDVLRPLPERLGERDILRLLDDVLTGLATLHAKGIVHRDLKPSNILLDVAEHAVLADLGIAHVINPDLADILLNPFRVIDTKIQFSCGNGRNENIVRTLRNTSQRILISTQKLDGDVRIKQNSHN